MLQQEVLGIQGMRTAYRCQAQVMLNIHICILIEVTSNDLLGSHDMFWGPDAKVSKVTLRSSGV